MKGYTGEDIKTMFPEQVMQEIMPERHEKERIIDQPRIKREANENAHIYLKNKRFKIRKKKKIVLFLKMTSNEVLLEGRKILVLCIVSV